MKKLSVLLSVAMVLGITFPVSAGWNFRAGQDLDVTIDYSGYSSLDSRGTPIYMAGRPVTYRVSIRNNNLKRPFKRFPIESTLIWSRSTNCMVNNRSLSFGAFQPLPGMSRSGVRNLDISPGGVMTFDVTYMLPMDVCPSRAEIKIDGGHGNSSESLMTYRQFVIDVP